MSLLGTITLAWQSLNLGGQQAQCSQGILRNDDKWGHSCFHPLVLDSCILPLGKSAIERSWMASHLQSVISNLCLSWLSQCCQEVVLMIPALPLLSESPVWCDAIWDSVSVKQVLLKPLLVTLVRKGKLIYRIWTYSCRKELLACPGWKSSNIVNLVGLLDEKGHFGSSALVFLLAG